VNEQGIISFEILILNVVMAIHSNATIFLFILKATLLNMIIETINFITKTLTTPTLPSFDNHAGEAMIPAFIE
jgi:hypothetical protein